MAGSIDDIHSYELDMTDPFIHKIILRRKNGLVIEIKKMYPQNSFDVFLEFKRKMDEYLIKKANDEIKNISTGSSK